VGFLSMLSFTLTDMPFWQSELNCFPEAVSRRLKLLPRYHASKSPALFRAFLCLPSTHFVQVKVALTNGS
jgi:hypothetical protein